MKLNPYEPPVAAPSRASFLRRLSHASRRAYRAYHAGMKPDRFLPGEHLTAWLSLIMMVIVLILGGVFLVLVVLNYFSRIELTGISF